MKTSLVLLVSLWLLALIPCGHAAPKSYAEFKALPPAVQRKLVADTDNPQHVLRLNWWWHLQAGDKNWLRIERIRLLKANENGWLLAFFQIHASSKQNFLEHTLVEKKILGVSTAELEQMAPSVNAEITRVDDRLNEVIQLLASVKLSDEARRLNEQAEEIAAAWAPNGGEMLSAEEMAQRDAAQQKMLDAVSHLPRYTPQETQALLDALPVEDLGFRIPIPQQ